MYTVSAKLKWKELFMTVKIVPGKFLFEYLGFLIAFDVPFVLENKNEVLGMCLVFTLHKFQTF